MRKSKLIILILLSLIFSCRLIHFDEEESITGTTTTIFYNAPIIIVKDETNRIIFSNSVLDIGAFPTDSLITQKIFITNEGNKQLNIDNIEANNTNNCSFSLMSSFVRSIDPQQTIEVIYNITPYNSNGDFWVDISIKSNDPKISTFNFRVKGRITSFIYVSAWTGNDSSNDGTMYSPYKTINKAISSNSGSSNYVIAVAAGTYDETIDINNSFSLYGGYYCNTASVDWNNRNVFDRENKVNYNTVIKNSTDTVINIIDVGSFDYPIVIEGFTIEQDNTDDNKKIRCFNIVNSNNIDIKNNTIIGGTIDHTAGTDPYQTIAISDSEVIIIDNNIDATNNSGTGSYSTIAISGIFSNNKSIIVENNIITYNGNVGLAQSNFSLLNFVNSSTLDIPNVRLFNNSISGSANGLGNSSSPPSYGIYIENCNVDIKENIINLSETPQIFGMFLKDNGTFSEIKNNTIVIFSSDLLHNYNIGMHFENNNIGSSFFYNNVIYIDRSSYTPTVGIDVSSDSSSNHIFYIRNNTLFFHLNSNINYCYGIMPDSNSYIENNILFQEGGGVPSVSSVAIYEKDSNSDPQTILNNDVYGFSYLYCDNEDPLGPKFIDKKSDFNKAANTNQRDSSTVGNNIIAQPKFKNLPPHALDLSLDTPQTIKRGGLFISDLNNDRLNRPRTNPYSIGAYECDQ